MTKCRFALSRALNDAADEAYHFLIEDTWPKAVKVRNSNFLRWALRTNFSTKYNLRVEIFDNTSDQRAHLSLHAFGGTKTPKGSRLAIPTSSVRVGSHGVSPGKRPRNIPGGFIKGDVLYQPVGKGRHRKLRPMYVLTKKVDQPADVPFSMDFETQMRESAAKHFPQRMMEAMRTRK
jgi:hypothetical protein